MHAALRRANLALACLSIPWVALAQVADKPKTVPTPAQVPTARELAPPLAAPSGDAVLPSAAVARELGKPQDEITLDVNAYSVPDGAPAELRAQLARLTAAYVGKGRSYEDLVNAASEVTRFMQRDLGLYLGYAYIPEQEPRDGVIRIGVLEGRLDQVVLNWDDKLPVRKDVVEAYLARLRPGSVLRVRDVERVVFLVNDLRGITARFEVKAGTVPGTASLVVTPRAEARWTGKADVDTNGSRFLGAQRVGALVSGNSLMGRGDALTVTALVSQGMRFALAGYTVPVSNDGLKLGASVSLVNYKINDKEFDPAGSQLGLEGDAATVNVYALYPWVRSRNLNTFVLASLEHKRFEDRQLAFATRKNSDTLTVGVTGDFRDSVLTGAVNTYELNVSSGQVRYDNIGQRPPEDDPRFTKFLFAYSRLQNVVNNRVLLYLALRAQHALNNLDTTEQFRLGGPDGVRAFAPGEGTGDAGALLTAELRLLPPEDWLGRLSREVVFSLFYDRGQVRFRHDPSRNTSGNTVNSASFSGCGPLGGLGAAQRIRAAREPGQAGERHARGGHAGEKPAPVRAVHQVLLKTDRMSARSAAHRAGAAGNAALRRTGTTPWGIA